jgi:hypothetical protein
MSKPLMMLCIYRPTVGHEEELFDLVKRHWPVLKKTGLATDTPATVYRAIDKKTKRPFFVEIFSWRDEKAPELAHQRPELMQLWEPMGPITENGPSPELAVVELVSGGT